jgi:hypothetical protein
MKNKTKKPIQTINETFNGGLNFPKALTFGKSFFSDFCLIFKSNLCLAFKYGTTMQIIDNQLFTILKTITVVENRLAKLPNAFVRRQHF